MRKLKRVGLFMSALVITIGFVGPLSTVAPAEVHKNKHDRQTQGMQTAAGKFLHDKTLSAE